MNSKRWERADFIKGSGTRRLEKEMDLAYSSGQMAPSMRDYGLVTRLMAKAE